MAEVRPVRGAVGEEGRFSALGGLMQARLWTGLFARLLVRDRQLALVFAVFPSVMLLIFHQAMGSPASGFAASCSVVVVEPAAPTPTLFSRNAKLVQALTLESFEGKAALKVSRSHNLKAALQAVQSEQATLVIDASGPAATLPVYATVGSAMGPYAESFAREALRKVREASAPGAVQKPVRAEDATTFTGGSGTSNDFLYGIPGMVVFGWCFGGITVALLVVREIQRGTLDRLRMSGAGLSWMVAGLWLAQVLLGLGQGLVTLSLAWGLGYRPSTPILSILAVAALLNALMSGVAIASGLMTASLASSDGAAANLGTMLMAPLAFLSGAVFPLTLPPLFGSGAWSFYPNDLLPSTPAIRVLSNVLVRGQAIGENGPALLLLLVETAMWIVAAALLFRARRWRTA